MNLYYTINITDPMTHIAKISISGSRKKGQEQMEFFLPRWSPGSYLMREYGKNVRSFKACSAKGADLYFTQKSMGIWTLDWNHPEFRNEELEFSVEYEVYCHELTVRTSHIDESHAFLHGPSLLMGVTGATITNPRLELRFPALWSKVTTGLKDVSETREKFVYEACDYDTLIDAPIEIGCHETDGFKVNGKDHELAFYGETLPHGKDLKADMKTIVEYVSKVMKSMPYEKYTFITHFCPGKYGGLEHLNSTALQFPSGWLLERKNYIKWLELVAHEYFHTWNVKRIRPVELGPFDYTKEAETRMHWLTEGLTSFMDQLLVLRSGLMTLEEYCGVQSENLKRYYQIPGRKFHSLEDSSFNAWVKLYRPDENSNNSSISYYLKGGLVFTVLHVLFYEQGKDMVDLLDLLWQRYESNKEVGVSKSEVLEMIEQVGGRNVKDQFAHLLSSCEEIDFEEVLGRAGLELEYEAESDLVELGMKANYQGDQVIVHSVELDKCAYKSGVNAGDELLAINGQRILKSDFSELKNRLMPNERYELTVSRLGRIIQLDLLTQKTAKVLKSIKLVDETKAKACFLEN
jgi:predicted metalloprotease with PDZ domain